MCHNAFLAELEQNPFGKRFKKPGNSAGAAGFFIDLQRLGIKFSYGLNHLADLFLGEGSKS